VIIYGGWCGMGVDVVVWVEWVVWLGVGEILFNVMDVDGIK